MGLYRIFVNGIVVGAVVADKKAANGFALGKFGAGASVERVAVRDAIGLTGGVCVIFTTKELGPNPKLRATSRVLE